jgi:hypothetical protein
MTEQPNMKPASVARYSLHGVEAREGGDARSERRELIAALAREGRNLSAADVRQLRRALYEDDGVSREEAGALFELDRAQSAPCAQWTEFFVEILTDHAVWQARPTGQISHEQAEWLLREADVAPSLAGFALLANVLAEAHQAPGWLVDAVRERTQAPELREALARAALRR